MCLAEIGRVVSVDGATASVDVEGRMTAVDLSVLVLDGVSVGPGDRLVCHLGLALERVTPEAADAVRAEREGATS